MKSVLLKYITIVPTDCTYTVNNVTIKKKFTWTPNEIYSFITVNWKTPGIRVD